jgi:hypothetical protein
MTVSTDFVYIAMRHEANCRSSVIAVTGTFDGAITASEDYWSGVSSSHLVWETDPDRAAARARDAFGWMLGTLTIECQHICRRYDEDGDFCEKCDEDESLYPARHI